MQWAAIIEKSAVEIIAGEAHPRFYSASARRIFEGNEADQRTLPAKVSCALCGTLIADEGRRMWMAFPSLFDFKQGIPDAFKPTCHIFYGSRVVDVADELPKWMGHKNRSAQL